MVDGRFGGGAHRSRNRRFARNESGHAGSPPANRGRTNRRRPRHPASLPACRNGGRWQRAGPFALSHRSSSGRRPVRRPRCAPSSCSAALLVGLAAAWQTRRPARERASAERVAARSARGVSATHTAGRRPASQRTSSTLVRTPLLKALTHWRIRSCLRVPSSDCPRFRATSRPVWSCRLSLSRSAWVSL